MGQTSPGQGRLSEAESPRPVFTLNQALPPHPCAARPYSINMDLIRFFFFFLLFTLLSLVRWYVRAALWESSRKLMEENTTLKVILVCGVPGRDF